MQKVQSSRPYYCKSNLVYDEIYEKKVVNDIIK